jgi:hypothetical protein
MKTPLLRFALVTAVLIVFCGMEHLEILPSLCIFKAVFGQSCLGCGTTRAMWSILRFDIIAALEYNKLIVITFPLLAGCTIAWIFRQNKFISK